MDVVRRVINDRIERAIIIIIIDGVDARAAPDQIIVETKTTDQNVIARAAVKLIASVASVEQIIPGATIKIITSTFTKQAVITSVSEDIIDTGLAVDDIIAVATIQHIIASAAEDHVIARLAVNAAIARSADQAVCIGRATELFEARNGITRSVGPRRAVVEQIDVDTVQRPVDRCDDRDAVDNRLTERPRLEIRADPRT